MVETKDVFFKGSADVFLDYMRHNTDYDKQRYREAVEFFEGLLVTHKKLMLHGGSLSYKPPYNKIITKESLLQDIDSFLTRLFDCDSDRSLHSVLGAIVSVYSRGSGSGLKYFIVTDPSDHRSDSITDLKLSNFWRDASSGKGYSYSKNKASERLEVEERRPGRLGLVKLTDSWKILEVCLGLGLLTATSRDAVFDLSTSDCFRIIKR